MSAPLRPDAVPAPVLTGLETAEAHLLNADLKAKRRVVAGTLSREEYAGLRAHFDAMRAHLRLLTTALDTPSIAVLTHERSAR